MLLSVNLNVIWAKGVVAAVAAAAERTAPFGFDGGDVDDDDEVSVVDGCFILGVLVIFTLLLVTLRLSYILIGLSSYAVVVATSIVVFYYGCCYSEVV